MKRALDRDYILTVTVIMVLATNLTLIVCVMMLHKFGECVLADIIP